MWAWSGAWSGTAPPWSLQPPLEWYSPPLEPAAPTPRGSHMLGGMLGVDERLSEGVRLGMSGRSEAKGGGGGDARGEEEAGD